MPHGPAVLVVSSLPGAPDAGWRLSTFVLGACVVILLLALRRVSGVLRRAAELESQIAAKIAELREASLTDPLTQTRNRRYFSQIVEPDLAQAVRDASVERDLMVFLIELDGLSELRRTHGDEAADAVLSESAERLLSALRSSDLVFRWGNEQFLLLARDAWRAKGDEVAGRLLLAFDQLPVRVAGLGEREQRASVGWAPFPLFVESPGAATVDDVIHLAGLALDEAKRAGGGAAVGVVPIATSHETPFEDAWRDAALDELGGVFATVRSTARAASA